MVNQQLSDTWEYGKSYEQYIGRWSRQVAPLFLDWLNAPAGLRWLDVGCGTGALCAAILERCAPAWAGGVEPSAGFLKAAQVDLAGQAALCRGTATHIPLVDGCVDALVSGLVLNFVPDLLAALSEMSRVTRAGGILAAYVWDYAGKMELLRIFWDAAVELDPGAASLDEGARFPVCHAEALRGLFEKAGLGEIRVTAIDVPAHFGSFDDYWQPFLGGQGPAPSYVMAMSAGERERLRRRLRERIVVQGDGSIDMIARAWAVGAWVDGKRER
jgi:SAM-dependent methyltransferase